MMKTTIMTAAVIGSTSLFAFSAPALAEYNNGHYNGETYHGAKSDAAYSTGYNTRQNSQYNGSTIEEATVLSADPVYRTVRINEPVEQCWDEKVYVSSHSGYRSHTPTILGAVIGAAVGNKFGSGRGRHVATAAGAVLGGSIGRDVQANNAGRHQRPEYQQRCELVDNYRTEQHVEGYDVTYRYRGQVLSTYTQHDPGSTIKVSVSVVPVE